MAKRDVVLVFVLAAGVGLVAGVCGTIGYLSLFTSEVQLEALSADRISASRLEIQNDEGHGFFFLVTEDGPQFTMMGKGG